MAITDKKKGVWGLDQTFNKINQGSIWEYSGISAIFAWGSNDKGQLGQNSINTPSSNGISSPVQITGTTWDGSKIKAYKNHVGAIKTDGTLWMWGDNGGGNLGQSNLTKYSSPVQVPGTTWSTLTRSSTSFHGGAIKTDGTLWMWGGNGGGQLGQNNRTQYSSPKQIPGTTWSMASQGEEATIAVKTDGTMWVWGANFNGQLGQNQVWNIKYSSPVQIPGTTWDHAFFSAYYGAMATRTDGTLWSWGYSAGQTYGVLGQNNNIGYSSPIQIPGTWATGADKFSMKYATAASVKADGTLWTWGNGSYGALGQNLPEASHRSSPVQVPGTTWNKVTGAWNTIFATKTDGTLWGWGRGDRGQLDNDSGVNYSSPVQITGSWPSFVTAGEHSVFNKSSI